MRTPRLAAGLAAAALLSVPAAHAAAAVPTYTPVSVPDKAGDVTDRYSINEVDKPAIDIVDLEASRNSSAFRVLVTYDNLQASSYTRRVVTLGESNEDGYRGTLIERRTGTGASAVSIYAFSVENGRQEFTALDCPAARATADNAADTILFKIPVACTKLASKDSAFLSASGLQWRSNRWQSGKITPKTNDPDFSDYVDTSWSWSDGNPARAPRGSHRIF